MFSALLAKARLVARVAARRISACCDEKSFSHVFKTENNVRFFARRSRSGVSRRRSIPSATVVSLNLHKKTPDEQVFRQIGAELEEFKIASDVVESRTDSVLLHSVASWSPIVEAERMSVRSHSLRTLCAHLRSRLRSRMEKPGSADAFPGSE
jgi:hypothetical protein